MYIFNQERNQNQNEKKYGKLNLNCTETITTYLCGRWKLNSIDSILCVSWKKIAKLSDENKFCQCQFPVCGDGYQSNQ